MEIDHKQRMETVQTKTSRNGGARAGSPDSARPSTVDFKSPQLKVFNPGDKPVNEIKNTANQKEAAAQLHVIGKDGDRTAPHIKTIGEAVPGRTVVAAGLGDAHNIASQISAWMCFVAALATKVLPKDSPLLKTLIKFAEISAKFTIAGISTLRGLYDALVNGKPLVALAQVVNGVVSVVVPTNEMTNARGAPIGMLNAFQGAEMIENGKHAKESYNSIGDHFSHQLQAWKSIAKQLRRNPMAILDSSQKGLKSTCIGGLMFLATVGYAATRPFSKTVSQWCAGTRDALGILVETEGLQKAHFDEGRIDLVTKSAKFSLGSLFNLLSKLSPEHEKFCVLANLGINASGNSDQMRSLARNEQNHIGNPMSVMDVIKNGLKSMVTFRSGIEQQLKTAAPVVVSQAQQSLKVQNEIQKVQAANGNGVVSNPGSSVGRATSITSVARNINAAAPVVVNTAAANKSSEIKTGAASVSAERPSVAAPVASTPVAPPVVAKNSFSQPPANSFARFADIPTGKNNSTPQSVPQPKSITNLNKANRAA